MKCPILPQVWLPPGEKGKWQQPDCLKEECAQWDDFNKRCDFKSIRVALVHLVATLEMIKGKMPHELQFRKV